MTNRLDHMRHRDRSPARSSISTAPRNADAGIPGASGSKPASPAQILFADKLAQEKGIVIPDEAKASSAAMSRWIDFGIRSRRWQVAVARVVNRPTHHSLLNPPFQKEISERRGKCRCHSYSLSAGSREFGNRYRTTDSLRQQGCRPETWRPLSSRRLVCPRGRRPCCLRRTWVAIEPSAAVEIEQASSWRRVRRERPASPDRSPVRSSVMTTAVVKTAFAAR